MYSMVHVTIKEAKFKQTLENKCELLSKVPNKKIYIHKVQGLNTLVRFREVLRGNNTLVLKGASI